MSYPFRLYLWLDDQGARVKTIATFPTYAQARRACRRADFKRWQGLVSGMMEVAVSAHGIYYNLEQPTLRNYSRQTFTEWGSIKPEGWLAELQAFVPSWWTEYLASRQNA